MLKVYRPWGQLHWLLPKLPQFEWSLIGVLGTEDRCLATLPELAGQLGYRQFWHIIDPFPAPASAFDARYKEIGANLSGLGVASSDIVRADLLENIDTIREMVDHFVGRSSGHIILDLSSMPKWWFFPTLRFLVAHPDVESLVVTYASAVNYGDQLSSDPDQLAPLPTFDDHRDNENYDELIIGVGFAPLGLKDMYEKNIGKIRYLFPFPPGPPNFFRNWQFLRSLEEEVQNNALKAEDRWLVHMYDVPSAFDGLSKFTKQGERTSVLAPFGPKTLSLAMCLFALAAEEKGCEPVHAFYTQPRRYSLDYSSGIKFVDGRPDIRSYLLKSNRKLIYSL